MTYTQYLQMGGATNPLQEPEMMQMGGKQPSIQEQVETLVKVAMSNQPEAAQAQKQIQKIMQAAQAGDQQALQIAQLIQKEIQKLQGAQKQQQGGEVQQAPSISQQAAQQTAPMAQNAALRNNTSLGTQMYGDASAAPISQNDYAAPRRPEYMNTNSTFTSDGGDGYEPMQTVQWQKRGGLLKRFKGGGKKSIVEREDTESVKKRGDDYAVSVQASKDREGNINLMSNDDNSQLPAGFSKSTTYANGSPVKYIRMIEYGVDPLQNDTNWVQSITEPLGIIRHKAMPEAPQEVEEQAMGGQVKTAKSGCACKLERRGGRIIEVDSCTGLKIRR